MKRSTAKAISAASRSASASGVRSISAQRLKCCGSTRSMATKSVHSERLAFNVAKMSRSTAWRRSMLVISSM